MIEEDYGQRYAYDVSSTLGEANASSHEQQVAGTEATYATSADENLEELLYAYYACESAEDESEGMHAFSDAPDNLVMDTDQIVLHASDFRGVPHITLTPPPPQDPFIAYANCANARRPQDPAFLMTPGVSSETEDDYDDFGGFEDDDSDEEFDEVEIYCGDTAWPNGVKGMPVWDLDLVSVAVETVDSEDEG